MPNPAAGARHRAWLSEEVVSPLVGAGDRPQSRMRHTEARALQ